MSTDSDLIRGLQALGRQEREKEEEREFTRALFDKNRIRWGANLTQKVIASMEEDAERQARAEGGV